MSYYSVTSPTNNMIYGIVGWDYTIETFFLECFAHNDPEEAFYIRGFSPKDIPDIAALNIECQKFNLELTSTVQTNLAIDFEGRTETTLQKQHNESNIPGEPERLQSQNPH